jgi:hypothetical protein
MTIPVRKVFWLLLGVGLFLMVMHFFPASISEVISDRFDMNVEANVPTWFASMLLFSVALCAFCIHSLSEDRLSRWFWLVFSLGYLYLSVDEDSRIHELINSIGVLWVYVLAPFALAFFVMCAVFLARGDHKSLRNWILGGLAVYALGVLGCEAVANTLYPSMPALLHEIEYAVEEGLELIGTTMVLTGCLGELSRILDRRFIARMP